MPGFVSFRVERAHGPQIHGLGLLWFNTIFLWCAYSKPRLMLWAMVVALLQNLSNRPTWSVDKIRFGCFAGRAIKCTGPISGVQPK